MPHEWSHGEFYWNELMTRDAERAKKFYADTLGWNFEAMAMPDGTYWVAKMGDKSVGGLFPLSSPQFDGVPESWMSYLAVDDVDARVKKAQSAGATLMRPIFDVPNVGRIAILPRAGRRRHRLDDTSKSIERGTSCNTMSFLRANGWPRAKRCSPGKRSSPRRAINLAPRGARCPG